MSECIAWDCRCGLRHRLWIHQCHRCGMSIREGDGVSPYDGSRPIDPREWQTQRVAAPFQVVGSRGQVLFEICEGRDGSGRLALFGPHGVSYFNILAMEHGCSVTIENSTGIPMVEIYASKEGGHLGVNNAVGGCAVRIHALQDDAGYITVKGPLGGEAVTVNSTSEGGEVQLYDPYGRKRG